MIRGLAASRGTRGAAPGTNGRSLPALCAAAALTLLALSPGLPAQHPDEHDPRALAEDPATARGPLAPVLHGLGDQRFLVTTAVPRAQSFIDQGLRLTYGFNHQEALRAFKEAARLDPDCAMAYWGWALVLGPNLNLPMREEAEDQAWQAIRKAVALRDEVSGRERALIDALAVRYARSPGDDRTPLDRAYADGMARAHRSFPADDDVATLYAAALMNLTPWDYWTRDGRPGPHTEDILALLEGVLARTPRHIGALHYYIHTVEPVDARRGEAAADTLRGLTPGLGHLVHMPSHIYVQVGRYREAFDVNAAASRADEGYLAQCRAQGIYALNYYPHNVHFQVWAAMLGGQRDASLRLARKVARQVPEDRHGNDWALYQSFLATPLFAMVRFGDWERIGATERPSADTPYWRGVWHFAQGLAATHRGSRGDARRHLQRLSGLAGNDELLDELVGFGDAARLLTIAEHLLRGELLARSADYDEAIAELDRAARLEAALIYNEPPDWPLPVRHYLGAVLLESGRPDEAAEVYWDDLRRHPDNVYALRGLHRALLALDRPEEASAVGARLREIWRDPDWEPTTSRF